MRLFVAFELPEPERQRLAELANGVPGARWVTPENLHLTLRFIGEVDGRDAQDIDSALSGLRCERFTMSLAGVGHFSEGQKPRQLWVGVEAGPTLQRLQAKIEQAIQRAGQAPERRKFKPHVTLARLRDAPIAKVQDFLTRNALYRSPSFAIGAFQLYSSFLTDNGPIYRAEAEYPLLPADNDATSATGR